MKTARFTMILALSLLIPGMTSAATILTRLSKAVFGVEDPRRAEASGWNGRRLDRESVECLSCHDGAIASDSPIGEKSARAVGMGSPGGSHPIGLSYSGVSSMKGKEYVPEMSLNPAIRLVDGMLSCVSCHEKKSGADKIGVSMNADMLDSCTASKRTVIDNVGSRLCFACHLK